MKRLNINLASQPKMTKCFPTIQLQLQIGLKGSKEHVKKIIERNALHETVSILKKLFNYSQCHNLFKITQCTEIFLFSNNFFPIFPRHSLVNFFFGSSYKKINKLRILSQLSFWFAFWPYFVYSDWAIYLFVFNKVLIRNTLNS